MRRPDRTTIAVGAHVEPGWPFGRETMHALPDPADPSQAVLQNVPFFVDGLNFGDLIRIGEPDEVGIHPVEAVVEPSGHVRFLLILEDQPVEDLFRHIRDLFDEHEVRMEQGGEGLVAVSMHPDVDPGEVAEALVEWAASHVPEDEDLWDCTAFEITEPIESSVGPLYPVFRRPQPRPE